jgi:hypothetical protein
MADSTQSYSNHSRYVPPYHFVAGFFLLLNLLWSLWSLWQSPGVGTAIAVLTAVALLILFLYARLFALTVQDRVIRIEERERLARLAPELAARSGEIKRGQFVALRFASDAELPALARRALDEGLAPNAIKQAIQTWRADHFRA